MIFWKLLFLLTLFLIFHNPLSEYFSNIHALIFGRGLSGRLFPITIFSGAILAASGLQIFIRKTSSSTSLLILLLLTATLFIIKIVSFFRYLIFPNSPLVYQLEFISNEVTIPLSLLLLLIGMYALKKYIKQSLASVIIIVLVLFDLLLVIQKVTPFSSASLITDQSLNELRSQLSDPIAKSVGFISTGENSLFNIPTFEGYDSIYPKTYLGFLKHICNTQTENFTNWIYLDEINCLASLQKYGLKYILDKDDLLISQLNKQWGEQQFTQEYELIKTLNNFSIYKYKNYKHPVKFSNSEGIVSSFIPSNGGYLLKINSPENQQLTIYLNYLDGWKAQINNQPLKLWQADDGFIALDIPSGNSEIYLDYFPYSLVIGLVISSLFTLLGLSLLIFKRRNI